MKHAMITFAAQVENVFSRPLSSSRSLFDLSFSRVNVKQAAPDPALIRTEEQGSLVAMQTCALPSQKTRPDGAGPDSALVGGERSG